MSEADRRYHEVAAIFPLMQGDEYESLKADIAANGQLEPVWLHPDDHSIIDGRNRHRACVELGIDPKFRYWDGNGSLVSFVVSLNLKRRHLNESQRAMVAARVATMTEGRPGKTSSIELVSQSEAAKTLNVGIASVKRAKNVQDKGAPALVAAVETGKVSVSAAAKIAQAPPAEQVVIVAQGPKEVVKAAKEIKRNGMVIKPHVGNNSGDNEWYTPQEYIAAAIKVLGWIDLDPATSETANQVVQADEFYTKDDDGLSREWTGKVWMNPPYSSDLIGKFCAKLCDHYSHGDVTDAIVLVNNATETAWFQGMTTHASAICFPRSRVRFWKPDGELGAPLQGQAILYFGKDNCLFKSAFGELGFVATING